MKTTFTRLFMPLVLTFTLVSCSNDTVETTEQPTSATLVTNYNYKTEELELIQLINNYRTESKLSEFQLVNHISHISQQHNLYMIQHNMISHANFTLRSNNLKQILGATEVAENVAYNYSTSEAVLNAWINSPEHKENLDGDWTHFGLSISIASDGKKYYTNMFIK